MNEDSWVRVLDSFGELDVHNPHLELYLIYKRLSTSNLYKIKHINYLRYVYIKKDRYSKHIYEVVNDYISIDTFWKPNSILIEDLVGEVNNLSNSEYLEYLNKVQNKLGYL